MIRIGITFLLTMVLVGCQKDEYSPERYCSEPERDSLLTNIITYMGPYAKGATNETRFEPRFRSEYVAQLKSYQFKSYFISKDSTHYFLVIRPVGGGAIFKRAVGGKFKIQSKSLLPVEYEEMWCSPHFKKDSTVLNERADYVFSEMIKKGNVNHLLSMKHYIEWPDSMLQYDKTKHEWAATKKAIF